MNNKKNVTIFGNEVPISKEGIVIFNNETTTLEGNATFLTEGKTNPFSMKKVKQKKDDTKKQD